MSAQQYSEDQIDYGECSPAMEDEYYEEEVEDQTADTEEMMKRMAEMDEELKQTDNDGQKVNEQLASISDQIDEKSIYVGQVDYEASPEELQALFSPCGEVERVTIICDKATGQSKGYAYIQFVDKTSIEKALQLDNTTFKGRQLKVYPKRHNLPTFIRDGRGRGGRGGRGGRFPVGGRGGYFYPGGRFPSGRGGRFPGRFPGRGAGRGRGRGGYFYSPY